MKCLIYLLSTGQSGMWLDTDVPYPNPLFGNFELDPNNIPPEYQEGAMAFGYWVRDGALTQVPPPPTLTELSDALVAAVRAKRADRILAGVPLAGGRTFAPDPAQLGRLSVIAINHIALDLETIDIEMGSPQVWESIDTDDLEAAYLAYVHNRELCYTNERTHLEAIQALLTAADRAGLESYDTTTGWPA